MKCLTVIQPWAEMLMGPKRYENRTWKTSYRGPLLIHAGKSRKMREWVDELNLMGYRCPPVEQLEFGAFIGVVDMIGCSRVEDVTTDYFAEGPWCFVMANPRRFVTPVPYVGHLGLFDVADKLVSVAMANAKEIA